MASSITSVVETVLKLRGSSEFQKAAKSSAKSILGIGDAGEESGKKASAGWKGIMKWAGGAAVVGGAAAYMKSAVSTTQDLAKNTMALQRVTGMDTKTASEWVAMAKTRGIDTGKLNIGMVTLSKQIRAASLGSTKAATTFEQLGVSQDAIVRGDTGTVINQLADGLAGLSNPAQRAAAASQLLGKQGLALLPVLTKGSGAIKEQLNMYGSFGAKLDGNATAAVTKQIAAQREWQGAMLGLKVQLGSGLMPAVSQLAGALVKLLGVLKPIISNSKILQGLIIALTAAFAAYKLGAVIATVASWGLNAAFVKEQASLLLLRLQLVALKVQQFAIAAATKAWAAAQWLLNTAMDANPVALFAIGIVALGVAVVVLYKKVGWFRQAVQATWSWIKANWPTLLVILTGPVGIAVDLIIKNFGKIKNAAKSVLSFVKSIFSEITRTITNVFSGGFVSGIGHAIADWLNRVTPFGDKIDVGPLHFRLPALAAGGTMTGSGLALVGERGPEVVSLPGGSTVYPSANVAPLSAPPNINGTGGQTIVTQVLLDRKVLAEAVGTYAADKRARR